MEEYIAVRKSIESYADLKAQGHEIADPKIRAHYENMLKMYSLENKNDDLIKFVYDHYLPIYRNPNRKKMDNPKYYDEKMLLAEIDPWYYPAVYREFHKRAKGLQ